MLFIYHDGAKIVDIKERKTYGWDVLSTLSTQGRPVSGLYDVSGEQQTDS